MNSITSNTGEFSDYIYGAVNHSGGTYSRPKYGKAASVKGKNTTDSEYSDIPPLVHSWKNHLNLNSNYPSGRKWTSNASIPEKRLQSDADSFNRYGNRKTLLPKYFSLWVDAINSSREFYRKCKHHIERIQRKRIIGGAFMDWRFAFKCSFLSLTFMKSRLKKALQSWHKYVRKQKSYFVRTQGKLIIHLKQRFFAKLKLFLVLKHSYANKLEKYTSVQSRHRKLLLLTTLKSWHHLYTRASRSKQYMEEEMCRKQKIKVFLENLSSNHHALPVKERIVPSKEEFHTKKQQKSYISLKTSVKAHVAQPYNNTPDIPPPAYESIVSNSREDAPLEKAAEYNESNRKQRLSWFRKQAQDRVALRRKEEETLVKERKRKEEDDTAKLMSEERQIIMEKRQKHERFLKSDKLQGNQQIEDKQSKAHAFYEKNLLIRCGISPWLQLVMKRRNLIESANQHRALCLKRNAFNRLFSYSTCLRSERIRREFRLSILADHHYSRTVLRKVFQLFHSRMRILRAKGNVVLNHLSRIHLLRRSFLGWKIAGERRERREAKAMQQVSYISEKSIKKSFFKKWVSSMKINRIEREIEYRSNQKWSAIKSLLRK